MRQPIKVVTFKFVFSTAVALVVPSVWGIHISPTPTFCSEVHQPIPVTLKPYNMKAYMLLCNPIRPGTIRCLYWVYDKVVCENFYDAPVCHFLKEFRIL